MKKKHILFLLFSVLINTLYSQIVINEYSAANYESHLDNYGEYEDWIELYNTTSTDIDLNGWFVKILSFYFFSTARPAAGSSSIVTFL